MTTSDLIRKFEQLSAGGGQGWPADVVELLADGESGAAATSTPPTQVKATTKRELLEAQGFPPDIADAFEKTADETQSVIMSRVPGIAVLELVAHGHDLKSYQIKAKSCNWGPMSGFLCQLGPFNKKGWPNAAFNDDKFVHYFEFLGGMRNENAPLPITPFLPLKLCDGQKNAAFKSIGTKESLGDDVWGVATDKPGDEATVCMEFLVRKAGKDLAGDDLWSAHHGQVFIRKAAADGTKTWVSYLDEHISYAEREATGTYIVHDKEKPESRKLTVGALLERWATAGLPGLVPGGEVTPISASDGASSILSQGLTNAGVTQGGGTQPFYPINVAQNPFPPYCDPDQVYKNAVTGDYDLFAVWPKLPPVGRGDLRRLADLQMEFSTRKADVDASKTSPGKNASARQDPFFIDVPGKPFALELRASPNVFVEIIPGYKEIGAWEDPEAGNINAAVATAAQTLNSFTFAHMLKTFAANEPKEEAAQGVKDEHAERRKKFTYPNQAFHSDEGGRPGIDEIDFPVAVFLPESVATELRQLKEHPLRGDTPSDSDRVLILGQGEYAKFLRLCLALRHRTYVLFNHIWLTRLFGLFTQPTKNQLDQKDEKGELSDEAKMFTAIQDDQKKLPNDELQSVGQLLSALFIAGQLRLTFPKPAPGDWGVAAGWSGEQEATAARASMNTLAKAFMDAVAKAGGKEKHDVLAAAKIEIPERQYIAPRKAD